MTEVEISINNNKKRAACVKGHMNIKKANYVKRSMGIAKKVKNGKDWREIIKSIDIAEAYDPFETRRVVNSRNNP